MEPSSVAQVDITRLADQVRLGQLPTPTVRRRTRVAARVSIREAAAAVGVAPMTLLRWERGEAEPRREHAIAYRRLLDALAEATA